MSFSNPLLDLAIGMIAFFLVVALMVTAMQEGIAQILSLRANMLRKMLKEVMDGGSGGDAEITKFMRNPIISTMNTGSFSAGPSYISRDAFTAAVKDVYLELKPGVELMTAVAALPEAGSPVENALRALAKQAQGNLEAFDKAVGNWFDAMMDRLSGKYKRLAQITTFGTGLVIAALGNLDTIAVGSYLANAPKAQAELAEALRAPGSSVAQASLNTEETRITTRGELRAALENAKIPMGWRSGFFELPKYPASVPIIFGWLLTAVAGTLGAAFWFDTLKRFVNIRPTGPDEESAK